MENPGRAIRNRSWLGLSVMLLGASCVPPDAALRVAGPAAAITLAEPASLRPVSILPIAQTPPGPPLLPLVADTPANDFATLTNTPAPPFVSLAQGDDASRALDCLTAAVYYEARSESIDGQRAVAQVVLNRVRNPAFPNSVCGVVYQGSTRATGCQFTFTCDGSLLFRREPAAWETAREVAQSALAGSVYAPVGSATYYHTTAVLPWWAQSLSRVATIGAHIFYKWDGLASFGQRYSGIETGGQDMASAGIDGATPGIFRYATGDGAFVTVHRGPPSLASASTSASALTSAPGSAPASAPERSVAVAGVRVHFAGLSDRDEPAAAVPGVRIHVGATPDGTGPS